LYSEQGAPAKAADAFGKAVRIAERLAGDHPGIVTHQQALGTAYYNRGTAASEQREYQDAMHWFAKAEVALEKALGGSSSDHGARRILYALHSAWAAMLGDNLNNLRGEIEHWDAALKYGTEEVHGELRISRARALVRLGDYQRATVEADALARGKHPSATLLYTAACVYSIASAAARVDSTRTARDGEAASEAYASRALALLAAAKAAGYFRARERNLNGPVVSVTGGHSIGELRSDRDLDPLRARGDFELLMMDFTFPANPFVR
jgi:tetratricopeptide (TPR) repeat protein